MTIFDVAPFPTMPTVPPVPTVPIAEGGEQVTKVISPALDGASPIVNDVAPIGVAVPLIITICAALLLAAGIIVAVVIIKKHNKKK